MFIFVFIENLMFSKEPQPVFHPEIGRYFQEYCGGYYIPNGEKQEEYPDDLRMTEKLLEDNQT